MKHVKSSETKAQKTSTAWLQVGAQIGHQTNEWSGRHDIIAYVGPGAAIHSSPLACFNHATSEIELNVDLAFGKLEPSFIGDFTKTETHRDYPLAAGAVWHEAMHARFTNYKTPAYQARLEALAKESSMRYARTIADTVGLFEESRVEACGLKIHAHAHPYIRAAALAVAIDDLKEEFAAGNIKGLRAFAHLAAIVLARVDAGSLEEEDVEGIRAPIVAFLGEKHYESLREIWLKAQRHEAHTSANFLVDQAIEWEKILTEIQEEKQKLQEQKKQEKQKKQEQKKQEQPGTPGEGQPGEGTPTPGTPTPGESKDGESEESKSEESKSEESKSEEGESKGSASADEESESSDEKKADAKGEVDEESKEEESKDSDGKAEGESDKDSSDADTPADTDSNDDADTDDDDADTSDSDDDSADDSDDSDSDDDTSDGDDDGDDTDFEAKAMEILKEIFEELGFAAEDIIISVVEEIADIEDAERATLNKGERESRAKNTKDSKEESIKVFSTASNGSEGRTRSRLIKTVAPSSELRAAAIQVGRQLEKAKYHERDEKEVSSILPPGKLHTRVAVQGAAYKAKGSMTQVAPFRKTVRKHTIEPTLNVGVMVDISGSMNSAMLPMANTAWIMSEAVRRVQGKCAMVYYGNSVFPTLKAGEHLKDVNVYDANDGTEEFDSAFKALNGSLDLLYGNGARLLVVVSDGNYRQDMRPYARKWMQECNKNGVAVLWLNNTSEPSWNLEEIITGLAVSVVPMGENPADAAVQIGKAAADALTKAGQR